MTENTRIVMSVQADGDDDAESTLLEPIPVRPAIRLFKYVLDVAEIVMRAQVDGELSRYVAPTAEVERRIMESVFALWRGIGVAVREGHADVRLDLADLSQPLLAVQTMSMLPTMIVVCREVGVDVPEDPESLELLASVARDTELRHRLPRPGKHP